MTNTPTTTPVQMVRIRASVMVDAKVAAARARMSLTDWITRAIVNQIAREHQGHHKGADAALTP